MSSIPMLNKKRDGQTDSNPAGPEAILATIRRIAANGEITRRSDGQKDSVRKPPMAPANAKKVGDVTATTEEVPDKNKGMVEGVPPFAKESLSGDGWTRASAKARQMFAAKK